MTALSPSQILIIDDHPSVRTGVKQAIENAGMVCCGEAASRAEAFAQIAHKSPDGVVLDINLPDGSGLDIVQWIRKHSTEIAIVILTFSDEESQLIAAMRAGASAFVTKSAPINELISLIRSTLELPKNFSATGIAGALKSSESAKLLTPRELGILTTLALPGTNRELAKSLHISEATFKTHLASIYRKLGVANRLAALRKAREIKLL